MRTDRELHHFITEPNRFRILQVVLEHAEQLPTLYEITQFCPDLDREAVASHVEDLQAAEVLEAVELDPAERRAGYPHRFFGVTERGWRFLLAHGLADPDAVASGWEDVDVEDPEELARHESAPRPGDGERPGPVPTSRPSGGRLEEYMLVVEQSRDALYMLDADGRYVLVNAAYEDLTGYDRADLVGASTETVLDSADAAERRELIRDLLDEDTERRSHTLQSTLQTADGEPLPVEVKFSVLRFQDRLVGVVGSARDISGRRRRQQELSVLSRVLRHNLSNKVNVIQGYAEVIEDRLDETGPRDYAARIQSTAEKLIQQSEKARDIHDLLQAWPPELRAVDVTDVVGRCAAELEHAHPEATVATDLPELAWVSVPEEFERAVRELLRNGIEHAAREDPHVRVRVTDAPAEGAVTVEVADNGPGIPDHEKEVIATNEETPLSHSEGLGLWLVNWIVASADGDIAFAESDLGGSAVELRFPRAKPPALTLSM